MKTLLYFLLFTTLPSFAYSPKVVNELLVTDNSCGRVIAGLHPSIRWGGSIAVVKTIDGVKQFDNRNRFRLSPGKHIIEFVNNMSNDSTTYKINIKPNTNYYVQWITDYTPTITVNNMPANEKYSGPLIYKTLEKQCEQSAFF